MTYQLAPWSGESISVPQVVFNQLARGEENLTRVALYILSTRSTDPVEITRVLRLKSTASAQRALDFWYGAGLLERKDQSTAGPQPEAPIRPPRLTSAEVAAISCTDPQVAVLVNECQKLLGMVINQNDTNILISLYHNDKIPVDTILYGITHALDEGHRSIRYVERILLRWKESGIVTGEDAERYLHLLEQRKKTQQQVSEVLGCPKKAFTLSERNIIASWFEEYHYDISMVQEAALYAEGKNDVRYINGILKKWYAKGWRTPKDVQAANALTGANIQPSIPVRSVDTDGIMRRKKPLEFLVEEE